jgi:acyl-CoA dehydrogenase
MDGEVRPRGGPIEPIADELDQAALQRIYAPLQQVKARGLWAAHLDPDLGARVGQLKLGLLREILGSSPYAPKAFGCQAPDSEDSEILAIAGTPEQKERWLQPLLAGDMKSAFSMTEPDTARAVRLTNCQREAFGGARAVAASSHVTPNCRRPMCR